MATLLKLKMEVENTKNSTIKLVFSGATEAHLLTEDIGNPLDVRSWRGLMKYSS